MSSRNSRCHAQRFCSLLVFKALEECHLGRYLTATQNLSMPTSPKRDKFLPTPGLSGEGSCNEPSLTDISPALTAEFIFKPTENQTRLCSHPASYLLSRRLWFRLDWELREALQATLLGTRCALFSLPQPLSESRGLGSFPTARREDGASPPAFPSAWAAASSSSH